MIYLDYSATTPIDPEVLRTYCEVETTCFANANSPHFLGRQADERIKECLTEISQLLCVLPEEIIFTSSATEANNLAIKGYAGKHPERRHIITSPLEHSSVVATLGVLQKAEYDIDMVELDEHGRYDLISLASLIRPDTLMISLVAVDSETGIRQPVEEAAKLAKQHHVTFHCDLTQTIGKCSVDMSNMDLAVFSAHKFYGPKGIAALIKKKGISLTPMINGGHSTTSYRSGTPATAMIAALTRALSIAETGLDEHYRKVDELRTYLLDRLDGLPGVYINSNDYSIPQIVNISVPGTDPDKWIQSLSEQGICLSSKSACSGKENFSRSVDAITHDDARATSSLRISLSYKTELFELRRFADVFERFLREGKCR